MLSRRNKKALELFNQSCVSQVSPLRPGTSSTVHARPVIAYRIVRAVESSSAFELIISRRGGIGPVLAEVLLKVLGALFIHAAHSLFDVGAFSRRAAQARHSLLHDA